MKILRRRKPALSVSGLRQARSKYDYTAKFQTVPLRVRVVALDLPQWSRAESRRPGTMRLHWRPIQVPHNATQVQDPDCNHECRLPDHNRPLLPEVVQHRLAVKVSSRATIVVGRVCRGSEIRFSPWGAITWRLAATCFGCCIFPL